MKNRYSIWILIAITCLSSVGVSAEDTTIQSNIAAQQKESISIRVLGEIRTPGKYDLPQKATIEEAIKAAGGLTGVGDSRKIFVTRELPDGSQATFRVDLSSKENEYQKCVLLSDDIVFIPAGCIF